MIMQTNPFTPLLLGAIGITKETVEQYPLGRFRDAYTNDEGNRIFILHRNYGTDGAAVLEAMAKHPLYVGNQTAHDDSTYGVWEFRVDERFAALIKEIAERSAPNIPKFQQYMQMIKDMGEGKDTPETKRALAVGKTICDSLKSAIEGGPSEQTVISGDGAVDIVNLNPKKKEKKKKGS